MGEILFCDVCGASVPIIANMQNVVVGGTDIAGVCFNCASALKQTLMAAKAKALAKHSAVRPRTDVEEVEGGDEVA